jgi:hypothetical protein
LDLFRQCGILYLHLITTGIYTCVLVGRENMNTACWMPCCVNVLYWLLKWQITHTIKKNFYSNMTSFISVRRLCGMYNFTINPSCGWDVNKTEVPCWEIATLSARYRTQCNNSFWALCSWWVVHKRPVINCTGISRHHLWRRHFYTSPTQFAQLYTLHAMVDDVMYPLVFGLLLGKCEEIYDRYFNWPKTTFQQHPL